MSGNNQQNNGDVTTQGAERKRFSQILKSMFRTQESPKQKHTKINQDETIYDKEHPIYNKEQPNDNQEQPKDDFAAWGEPCYQSDGLRTYYRNMAWLKEPDFARAYDRGMNSGHKMGRPKGSKNDIHIEWRVHMILWAAKHASLLEGDFVECGVNTGILSLAACDYLSFDKNIDRKFWLFDTFQGIPVDQASESEMGHTIAANETSYEECYELAVRNFAPYPNAILVRGKVPETFRDLDIKQVAYLSIDMNIAKPEVAAMEFFWDKLVKGAPVVFDDYAWAHCGEQHDALNEFANSRGVKIAALPTGQGLLIKP